MDVGPLRRAAPPSVHWLLGYRPEAELAALVERAALVVLPYREIEQSGVLFTALGAGKPLVLSAVGGFAEVEAAAHVPPGDADALRETLRALLEDPERRERLGQAAARAAREEYGWDPIAHKTLALYRSLVPD
jgi:glycosyltransferase involved in cell wall biosynthesis